MTGTTTTPERIAVELKPDELQQLLEIFDSAHRWIDEFNAHCYPQDFEPGYGDKLKSQSYAMYRLRQRLQAHLSRTPSAISN